MYIPTEIIEIIISYVTCRKSLEKLIKILPNNVSWGTVCRYNFGVYKNISYEDYIKYIDFVSLTYEYHIDHIVKFKNAQYCYLNKLNMVRIPTLILDCNNLTHLNLSCNQIRDLPIKLFKLSNLESLDLSYNRIKSIPREIWSLHNLTHLYLNNNNITEVPNSMYHIMGNLNKLKELNLSHNQIKTIPIEIWGIRSLEYLILNDNHKIKIPNNLVRVCHLRVIKLNNYTVEYMKDLYRSGIFIT
jgi:Leucine-rich repeat (LRR) protein